MFFVSPLCLAAIRIKSTPPPLSSLSPLQGFSVLHLLIAVGFGPWFITRFTKLLLHGSNKQNCNSSKFAFQRVLAEGNSLSALPLNRTHAPVFPEGRDQRQTSEEIFCPSLTLPSFFVPVSPGSCHSWSPEAGCRETANCCKVAQAAEEGCSGGYVSSHSRKARQGGEGMLAGGSREGWSLPTPGGVGSHSPG